MAFDLLIENSKGLVQVRDSTPTFLAGSAMGDLPILPNAFVAVKDGLIVDYGRQEDAPS